MIASNKLTALLNIVFITISSSFNNLQIQPNNPPYRFQRDLLVLWNFVLENTAKFLLISITVSPN